MAIFDLLDEYEQIQLRIIVTLENMPAPVITTVSELSRLLGASEFVIKKAVQTLAHESMDELSWLFTLTFDRNTITYVRVTNSSPVTSIRYLNSRKQFRRRFHQRRRLLEQKFDVTYELLSAPQTSDSLLSETSSGSIRASSFDW